MTVHFNLPLHDLFVKGHGEALSWYKAHKCACGSVPDANRANVNCRACGGFGYVYDAPVPLRGMVVGIQSQRLLLQEGVAEFGDLVLSLSPSETTLVRDWDKFTISGWTEGHPYAGEVVLRGVGATDTLRFGTARVTRVFSVVAITGAITDYVAGVSYTVSGRTLTWLNGAPAPGSGQPYTVDYDATFEWIAFSPTVPRRERAENLGQRVLLRRKMVATPPF